MLLATTPRTYAHVRARAHTYLRQIAPQTYAPFITDSEIEFLKTHFKNYEQHLGSWVTQQLAKNKVTDEKVFKMLSLPELLIDDILENAKIELYLRWIQVVNKVALRLS